MKTSIAQSPCPTFWKKHLNKNAPLLCKSNKELS